jgi:magnesium chelatase family protein
MYAATHSAVRSGFSVESVLVECQLTKSLPGISISGLASGPALEARERVRGALRSAGFSELLMKNFVVNLRPADLPKRDSHVDAAIFMAIVLAGGYSSSKEKFEYFGTLGLDGSLQGSPAALVCALDRASQGEKVIIPFDLGHMISLIPNLNKFCRCAKNVKDLLENNFSIPETLSKEIDENCSSIWDSILGHKMLKEALIVAAAGEHHILLYGPPGTGKTMLASSLVEILPPIHVSQRWEVARLSALEGDINKVISILTHGRPPHSQPHHTASSVALVGGGTPPRPGAVSTAYQGVLVLDELPEFAPRALDALRQPLEDGHVSIYRAGGKMIAPATRLIAATMNLCPCGEYGKENSSCTCSVFKRNAYLARISGPLRERFDIRVPVLTVTQHDSKNEITLKEAIEKVTTAREILEKKSTLSLTYLQSLLQDDKAKDHLKEISNSIGGIGRGLHRILRLARTIAAIDERYTITSIDLEKAWNWRGRLTSWE